MRKKIENFLVLLGIIAATVIVSWILEVVGTTNFLSDLPYWTEDLTATLTRSSVIIAGITLAVGMAIYGLLWYFRWGDDDKKRRRYRAARKEKQKMKSGQAGHMAGDLEWRYKGILKIHEQYLSVRKTYNKAQVDQYGNESAIKAAEKEHTKAKAQLAEAINQLKAVEKDALKDFAEDFAFLS